MALSRRQRVLVILICMGLVAGSMGGLFGIGGGILIVPGLVFFLGFGQHRAHGTSLLSALLLASSGVVTYSLEGCIEWSTQWPIALEVTLGGVLGAMVGAKVAGQARGKTLRRIFAVFIVLVGIKMLWAGCVGGSGPPDGVEKLVHAANPNAAVVVCLGLLTGFLSAMLGIGGGLVMVPALAMLLCAHEHAQQLAQGLSLAAMIPTAFTGMLMHRRMGNVDMTVGGLIGSGAVVGAIVGARVAASMHTHTLQVVFGIFLFAIAGLMLRRK